MNNPHVVSMQTQTCFSAQQKAHKLVAAYTKSETAERLKLRHITDGNREALEAAITREIYILDYTDMLLWTRAQLNALARRVVANCEDVCDELSVARTKTLTQHELAWMIAMVMVRDRVRYKFTKARRIMILKAPKDDDVDDDEAGEEV